MSVPASTAGGVAAGFAAGASVVGGTVGASATCSCLNTVGASALHSCPHTGVTVGGVPQQRVGAACIVDDGILCLPF